MNGLPNIPANYLPSKRSQLVSRNRIAKINELYEQKQKQHQDSVVSNNSTSVVSEDNCIPIHGLPTYRASGQYNVDEPSTTVKHEELPNNFIADATSSHQEPDPEPDNVKDDDYEDELRFTPKLKSRRSLLTMRKNFQQKADSPTSDDESSAMEGVSTPLPKVRRRLWSLRKSLGDPLPLPYLTKNSNSINGEHREPTSQSQHPASSSSVDEKRQVMESKWRKLVAQDKSMLESRLEELRKPSLPSAVPPPSRSNLPTLAPQLASLQAPSPSPQSLAELQQEIISNRQKLDEIIVLLNQRQKPSLQVPSIKFHYRWKEFTFWTLCIITLILCNFYVYYYL